MTDEMYHMYVVECADGSWYTGFAVDVEARVAVHNAGKGARYTRSRLPVRLVESASFATRHEALSAEYWFKRLSRQEKEGLVREAHKGGVAFSKVLARRFDLQDHKCETPQDEQV